MGLGLVAGAEIAVIPLANAQPTHSPKPPPSSWFTAHGTEDGAGAESPIA